MPLPQLVSAVSSKAFASSPPHSFAEGVVRHCLAEINQPVEPTTPLNEVALDSLTMVLLLISVEDALETRFPDSEVERIRNLYEFVAVIDRHTESKLAASTIRLARGA